MMTEMLSLAIGQAILVNYRKTLIKCVNMHKLMVYHECRTGLRDFLTGLVVGYITLARGDIVKQDGVVNFRRSKFIYI